MPRARRRPARPPRVRQRRVAAAVGAPRPAVAADAWRAAADQGDRNRRGFVATQLATNNAIKVLKSQPSSA